MIRFDNVSKFCLKDVTIHIPKGVSVGLIGASGAGKTTFVKLACGLLMAEQGKVFNLGCDMDHKTTKQQQEASSKMGVLFTEKSMFDKQETVISNMRDLQISYGIPESVFAKEYAELAEKLGFAGMENAKVKELSLGERRRAELGAVFLNRPQLFMLDEPTNGLDANAKSAFRKLVKERTKQGATLLMTSHNMDDIVQVCDRIIILREGRLLYYGSKERLLREYAPGDMMQLKWSGSFPDMGDLPILKYTITNEELTLSYNSNHISSAEILKHILAKTSVSEVTIRKPELEDVITQMERGEDDERDERFY